MYEIRDPIHTTITFTERERRLIDHPFCQRLRFIRQLGLKLLVYPGAVNDRFSHALGAMHLAGRLFDVIDSKSDVWKTLPASTRQYLRQTFRFAALLHDVGHGPFSHASETLMPRLAALKLPRSWFTDYQGARRATHEDYSVLLIKTLGSTREHLFRPSEAQDIASLVHKYVKPSTSWTRLFGSGERASAYHLFMRRLVSGELDVDRMDYLLRDSYFTGVPYGHYDLEWLLHSTSATLSRRGPLLVINEGGLRAFEDFLLARYHMFMQVYFHRTTQVFEHYVEQAIAEKEIELTIPSDPYAYVELRDDVVLLALHRAAKQPEHFWSRELIARRPAKFVYRLERGKPAREERYSKVIAALRRAKIPYFERSARRNLSEQVKLTAGASGIVVSEKFAGRLEYQPIERVSDLLQKYNEKIDRVYVYVSRVDYDRVLEVLRRV